MAILTDKEEFADFYGLAPRIVTFDIITVKETELRTDGPLRLFVHPDDYERMKEKENKKLRAV